MRKFVGFLGLAPYGSDEIVLSTLACGVTAYTLFLIYGWLAVLPAIPFSIVIWFFRNPERKGVSDPDVLLSPADGTVTDIVELEESTFLGGRALRIGIFLSPFNVHVNRIPCAGTVLYTKYLAGDFLPAYNPKAPERNESISLGIETPEGVRLLVKQITGVLARRIVCEVQAGDSLTRGERYGMIKFGSRTEVYIPAAAYGTALVKIGDKVKGGETSFYRINLSATESAPDRNIPGAIISDENGSGHRVDRAEGQERERRPLSAQGH